ncbi:hypothetical protein AMTR_s00022p00220300 [Amborella trichopoda]|uniref:Uncharacterized protein n=1 Tax=Amborella trichopoda TaxID=13333 RepID=W1PUF6_AMBTC|nr:hypothetical protein AMTR_s00022p00220300 [Amborella trichopoda]
MANSSDRPNTNLSPGSDIGSGVSGSSPNDLDQTWVMDYASCIWILPIHVLDNDDRIPRIAMRLIPPRKLEKSSFSSFIYLTRYSSLLRKCNQVMVGLQTIFCTLACTPPWSCRTTSFPMLSTIMQEHKDCPTLSKNLC